MNLRNAILTEEKAEVRKFLEKFSLGYDEDIDFTLYMEENKEIIGTISSSQNIIKSFAVDPKYRGQIASVLISEIINHLYKKGYSFYQVYTSPVNKEIFKALNFYEIISSDKVTLLESKNRDIVRDLKRLKHRYKLDGENIGSIIMNCNPFTLGHRYLIEEASKRHDLLIVFILEEDKSTFKYKDRFKMVELGVKDLKNVKVVPSSSYLISNFTFPTYFLKKEDSRINEQATIDALIFEKYFIPIFKLKKRYLGSEEDFVTKQYNEVLKNRLGDFIEIIKRKEYNNEIISASKVRKLINEGKFAEIVNLVPKTTYDYLKKIYE